MARFEQIFAITENTRILDVGGSEFIWQFARVKPKLTFLNLLPAVDTTRKCIDQVAGDGRTLPFCDNAFDVVFSNSTIEHVGTLADQQNFAKEVARVGRRYWVQTPNRRFPFEMHVMLPLVHYLPRKWQERLVHRFTGWEMMVPHTKDIRRDYLYHFLYELRLLDTEELQKLFPNAKIGREWFLGMPKSLIAYRD
jgi:hypothetical protein